jgi:V/A-type H+-transporting ATPase subunit B
MRKGAGPGRTRGDHLALAGQLVAALARARAVQELADLIGMEALTETDRQYLAFNDAFSRDLVMQLMDESRGLEDTLDRAWQVLSILPERELTMMPAVDIATYYVGDHLGREQHQPVDGGPKGPASGPPVTERGKEVPHG